MTKTVDLLDSLNQKFAPGASGMSSTNAQDGILEAYVLAADASPSRTEIVADATIDFADSDKQNVNASVHTNLTLTAPYAGNYILKILNSASLVSITPNIFWDSGTAPVWAGTSILLLYFDGTDYYGQAIVGAAQ